MSAISGLSHRERIPETTAVVVKITGDVLIGEGAAQNAERIAAELLEVQRMGVAGRVIVACVGGGTGNRGRELEGSSTALKRAEADFSGMNASIQNAGKLFAALRNSENRGRLAIEGWRSLGYDNLTEENKSEPQQGMSNNIPDVISSVAAGGIIVAGGGTGMPGLSTDMGALWTGYIDKGPSGRGPVFLKASGVDGVYCSDPNKNPNAEMFGAITYADAMSKGLQVVDRAAWPILEQNGATTIVFRESPGNLAAVMGGADIGTLVVPS